MSRTVLTTVVVGSINEVSDEDAEQLIAAKGAENLQEVANDMEEQVETIIAQRVFGDADEIPVLDVSTDVMGEGNVDEEDVRNRVNQ